MSEEIIAALIAAASAIIVAIIGLIGKTIKTNKIKQVQKGNSNIQIGIQNNYEKRDDRNE